MRISKDGYKSLEADGDRVDMESSDSVCRRSSIGSAYSAAHDGGTEVLEPIDEMKTGEEGKISVTSLVLEDIFMVPILEDDFRSAYETTHVVMLDPPEKEHHFDPSDLPWRRALIISGLWFPKTWVNGSCRRITAYSVQGSFVILLLLYYLTESGVLLPMKKWESSVDMASHLPFTMAHYAIWESRWLITYVLGIFYGHSRHLEKFVAKMTLPYSMLKKSICCQYAYAILLLVAAVIMPTVLHWAELQRWGHEGKLIPIIDALIFFIYRLVSIPSFCLVAFSLYYVGCNILTLGYRLYRIPGNRGLNSAKREVLVTKRMTTDTELSLQWYLLVHLTLVILALVTGIFSCIERFHVVEKSNNVTIVESVGFGDLNRKAFFMR